VRKNFYESLIFKPKPFNSSRLWNPHSHISKVFELSYCRVPHYHRANRAWYLKSLKGVMNIDIYQQKKRERKEPKKLYSQKDVDVLLSKKDAAQADELQKQSDAKTVANLIDKSNRILVSISSHAFLFDLFPDTINIEEGRVTIINRHLMSSEVHSIDIKDISNVFINTTMFFSQLVVISKNFEENEIRTRNLRTSEAIYARRIIEGLRVFIDKQIDTSGYSSEVLIEKLEQLSTTEIVM
jgi:hypothetical protein